MSASKPRRPEAKFEPTRTPGIFKRGSRYVFSYRVDGKQRWESKRTLEAARNAKAARTTDLDRGEFDQQSRVPLREYATEWIERYRGRGKGGFRENTRDEYRRQLEQYVFAFFPAKIRLTEVTPKRVAEFIGWLCEQPSPRPRDKGAPLSDATVRNIMAPLRACLSTAVREGLIRSNPARESDLPHRAVIENGDEDQAKAMTREELATVLALIPERHRLMFRMLAATGLRISEAIALQWRHLYLDGSKPHAKVRRALVRGRMGPPKSKYGKREVPIGHDLVVALREHHRGSEWPRAEDLVFPSLAGTPLSPNNVASRALAPAAQEADLSWIGFHTFRHTCASMLFAEGRNAKQVQMWLGHHSPAFTLNTYVHLLGGDVGEPLAVPDGTIVTCPGFGAEARLAQIEVS
jgi:integrase